tara:strand:- start:756 stop:932 length:177 start_codon:yes stop_codon:yes gene_type:complete
MKTNKRENLTEIRVEEVHDYEEGKNFYRIYFYYETGKIEVMKESLTKPILARYVSQVY